jgi:DNA-binding NtrC family response regulator
MTRVLVIDLDEPVRREACQALAAAGFEADSACQRVESIEKIGAFRPDLLLLDLRVTGLDGWGLLERLRETPSGPLIVVAGTVEDFADFARNVKGGVAAFIPKPLDIPRIGAACSRALSHAREDARVPRAVRDRRQQKRRALMVAVHVETREETPAIGELRDLSQSGAQVILIRPFEVGAKVHVALDPALVGRSLEFDGKVQWRKEVPTGFAHGLSFVDLRPDIAGAIQELLPRG